MNRLLSIFIVLLTRACVGQDYSVVDSFSQSVNAVNVNYLIVECYCENGVEINEIQTNTINIDVVGNLASEGYHGDQKKPKEIKEETLSFKSEIVNDTLRLVSKEWTYIHHSYLIDKLKLQIPKGLKYEIVKIEGKDLEGRKIE